MKNNSPRPVRFLIQSFRSRYGSIRFQFLDRLILGYAFLIPVLILLFNGRVQNDWIYLLGHAAVIAGILELLRLEARHGGLKLPAASGGESSICKEKDIWTRSLTPGQSPGHSPRQAKGNAPAVRFLLRFLRMYYPMLLLIFAWTEIGKLINLIFPFWLNRFVVAADLWLFGVHPTVWIERIFNRPLTEAMNFFYFSYYLFVPIATFPLYFKGKVQETFDMLFLFFLSYLASYILFMIFPAEGPRFILNHLHTHEPSGGIFLKLNSLFQSRAEIRGGCIPSSHVSVATTAVLACFRMNRPAAFILLFLTAGIAMATVYCRYHHAVDSLTGLAAGFLFYWAGSRFLKNRRNQAAP
ncbi:phosphatase PAP2 family protein [bacterium]|nr:phosphatase PAP2 family protein [bacterium]